MKMLDELEPKGFKAAEVATSTNQNVTTPQNSSRLSNPTTILLENFNDQIIIESRIRSTTRIPFIYMYANIHMQILSLKSNHILESTNLIIAFVETLQS